MKTYKTNPDLLSLEFQDLSQSTLILLHVYRFFHTYICLKKLKSSWILLNAQLLTLEKCVLNIKCTVKLQVYKKVCFHFLLIKLLGHGRLFKRLLITK